MTQNRKGGGYSPAWVSYDIIISNLLNECNEQYIFHSPLLYNVATALAENLSPFFSEKDTKNYTEVEKELERINSAKEQLVEEKYLSRKSDDVNAQQWNENLLVVISKSIEKELSFQKGCVIWKFCVKSDAFKRATRQKQTWVGEA